MCHWRFRWLRWNCGDAAMRRKPHTILPARDFMRIASAAGRCSITISSGSDTTTIPLEPAGKTGLYSARVVFPHAGTWSYAIDNGLQATGYGVSETTTYTPIEVGGGTSSGFALPGGWLTGIVAALLLALLAVWQLLRRRGAAFEPA